MAEQPTGEEVASFVEAAGFTLTPWQRAMLFFVFGGRLGGERATALDHHDWARDARFAAKHPGEAGADRG